MRKQIHHVCTFLVLGLLLSACRQDGSPTPDVPATSISTQTVTPQNIVNTSVSEVPSTTTPSPTTSPTVPILPTLTPVTIASGPDEYQLASGTADQADETITRMEQAVLAFWESQPPPGQSHPPYAVVWHAAWDALARFPDDPRAGKWRWKMVYYMALSGEGQSATEIYSELIANALNQQGIKSQELPNWFQSGELNTTYLTPRFTLEIEPITVPGNEAGYLVRFGELYDIDTPGSSCALIVENNGKFTPYIIHDGFPQFGFFIMLRNPSTCYAEDVTGDGIDEIIFDQYSGGHVGSTYIHIFDIPSLPPEVMPFAPAGDKNLTIWNGWIHDSPEVSGKKQIQIGVPLGFCEEHGLSSYQWNGAWFELSHGWVDFGQASYSDDDALFNCSGRIMEYARDLNHQDAISVFESAYKTYYPKIKDNFEMLEEFRLMQGLSSAYHGDQETVISIFAEIVNSPTIPDSAWIQPAQEFLEAYQSPTDLYQACSRVNICAPYVAQYSDEECVHRDLCDYQAALEASVATAFSTSALRQITNDLKLAGIRIPSEGKYDFDGDSRDELWFTVLHPGETEYELWIAAEYSQGVKVFLVADKLPKQTIKFEIVERDGLNIKTDFGFDQTIELVRHPISGEPFVVVQYVDEFNLERQVLVQFIELRQLLMEGNAVTPIYERLLEIERKSPDCPFEIQDEYGGIIQIYNCANYSHTLALAAELAGKDIEAVRRFYDVWSAYPESPFALLARLKLELRDR